MAKKFDTVNQWLEWQQTVHPLNIDFKLERILSVYKRLNIPKIAKKIITVAGTNGKGSTVSFLESVLIKENYKVGTFTSPHILRYNERIKINGIEIDDESLLEAFSLIDDIRGDTTLTYFEFATLSAFYLFNKANLDVVVLEVGLGGRLDATNIVDSDVSIITSIGIDHTEFLGNTIDSIALEKAGVMRPFKKCIFAQSNPPMALMKYAKNQSVNLLIHNNDYSLIKHKDTWSLKSKNYTVEDIPNLKMIGDYQYNYAAASLLALKSILPEINNGNSVKQAISSTKISGRFQYLSRSPDILLDVAHNEDAAKSLADNINKLGYDKVDAVLGVLSDKDIYSIVGPFLSLINNWHIGTINSERGMNSLEIKYRMNSIQKTKLSIKTYPSIKSAFLSAKSSYTKGSLLLIYGSFYTVSEALQAHILSASKKNAI
ncbi:MAG: folylpolyglutamate synthase/dihydrofolate synthase family protein [Gammaproteobacteria bacterium]